MRFFQNRLRASLLLLLMLAFIGASILAQDAASDLLKTADDIVGTMSKIRGLEPKGPIQKGVKTREEISKYLDAYVRDNYEDRELQSEGKMLAKLGLIPPDLDYKNFMLKLLSEQVGGFYDPEKKTFYIAGWLPAEQQKPVMVHELTHAIQDQYFDLEKIQKQDRKLHDDDRVLAHQALFEGDAMAVMLDYLLLPGGRKFFQLPDLVLVMHSQFSEMASQFEVFKQAPSYLQETLLFPYGYGAAFLQKVRAKEPWSAVDKIYSDLPKSTEQIIHAEKYLGERDDPVRVDLEDPSARLGSGWSTTYRDVVGEFSLYLLLKLQLTEDRARKAASGWGGDQIALVESDKGDAVVFFSSVWDSSWEAERYAAAMSEWFNLRLPNAAKSEDPAGETSWLDGRVYNSLRREDRRVNFIIGLPDSEAANFKLW